MAERSVVVRLRAEIADFQRKMKTAASAAQEPGTKAAEAADTLGTQVGLMGAAVTLGVGAAVKTFADFDQAMSNVAATGDDARGSIDALRAAAITAGAETAFSATEAANAIEELAKAGISAEDILNGGLDGALALAASDNLALADAAQYAATAMNQFNLKGDQAMHVADLLAAGAGKAMGGVDEMGQAMNQAGLVASGMGLSIEETVGSLAAFAQQGLLGSDAGTSFKTMLQSLANPSKESARLMDELGISAYDAGGNFVGMSALAANLQTALAHLSQEQRDAALAQIFGSDAVRAARVVYEEGAAGIDKWTKAVDDQGFAQEQAATKLDNLKGDLEEFSGSLETAMINAGEGANGPLRALVQRGTELVNVFNGLPAPVQQGTLMVAGLAGAAALAVVGTLKLASAARDGIGAMKDLGLITDKTGDRMTKWGGRVAKAAGVVGAAMAAATVAAAAFGEEFDGRSATEWESAMRKSVDTAELFSEKIDGIAGDTYDLEGAFNRMTAPNWLDSFDDWSGDLLGMASSADLVGQEFENMGQAIASIYQTNPARAAAIFEDVLAKTGGTTEELLDLMPAYRDALLETENAQDAAGDATNKTTAALQAQNDRLEENAELQREAAGVVLDRRAAEVQFEQAVADATKALEDNGATLDITTEKGRANRTALDDISRSSWDLIESMQEQGATQKELQGVMTTSRERFIGVATAMGMGADEANALADEMGLIPGEVKSTVNVDTATALGRVQTFLQEYAKIQSRRVEITTAFVETGIRPPAGFYVPRGGYTGGRVKDIVGYAGGGLLGGTPPSDPTEDNLLAVSDQGLLKLRSGEFIQSQPAVDHYGVGFMNALNNREIPKSMLGYASGGYHAPRGYQPPSPTPLPAPATGPGTQITVQVDASGLIDGDVARAIATKAERKLMDTFNTYGLGGVASGVAV